MSVTIVVVVDAKEEAVSEREDQHTCYNYGVDDEAEIKVFRLHVEGDAWDSGSGLSAP